MKSFKAGNWICVPWVVTPLSGTVALADVKAWTIVNGVATDVSSAVANVSGGVIAGTVTIGTNPDGSTYVASRAVGGTNAFYVDVFIPYTQQNNQTWTMRFKSFSPSPVITSEDTATGTFTALASKSPSP